MSVAVRIVFSFLKETKGQLPNDPNNAGKHNETSLNLICITTETDYCVSIVTWFFDEFFFCLVP